MREYGRKIGWVAILLLFTLQITFVHAQEHYIIATDTTFAPFEFQDATGQYVGIDIELLEAIAKDQGFTYEMRALGFNAALQALESGQVDGVIAGMSITEERKQTFDFSNPYYASGLSFAVYSRSDIETLEDLKGKKVAVKNGTAGAELANELASEVGFTVVTFEDSANMYEDVMVGNSDATIEDYAVIAYAIQQGQLDLKLIGEQYRSTDFGFTVQKGKNHALLTAFNTGLDNLKAQGSYDNIIEKYVGNNAQVASSKGFTALIGENWRTLLSGLWATLWITFVSIAIAGVLGVVLGLMRVSPIKPLSISASIYVDIMRGLPLIVLAFFIYFGIPQMTGWRLSATFAGIITLSLNAAAYIAEIVRGGINAIDLGQMEASRSLGLPYRKSMQRVVLPQAIRVMVPSLINQFVITLKDTSILSVIGLVELTQSGKVIIARTYQSGNMWLIIGIMYLVVITVLTKLSKHLEGVH